MNTFSRYRDPLFIERKFCQEKRKFRKTLDKIVCVAYDYIQKGDKMKNRIALVGEERMEWNRLRGSASQKVKRAVEEGKLVDLKKNVVPCVDCGSRATMYDHRDYNKPLDVYPVCASCNVCRGTNAPIIKETKFRTICPECCRSQVLYRIKTNSFVCRLCGHTWKRKEKK